MTDSSIFCFANDTRILLGILVEKDTQMQQIDLHKLDILGRNFKISYELRCNFVIG